MSPETVEITPDQLSESRAGAVQVHDETRDGGGRWLPGRSGNPVGRIPGSRNHATMFAQALFDHDLEGLVGKVISRALQGDPFSLKLCIERILAPRRQERVCFAMPPLANLDAAPEALAAIAAAAANGELSAAEAHHLTATVHSYVHAVETGELEERIQELEERERNFRERER